MLTEINAPTPDVFAAMLTSATRAASATYHRCHRCHYRRRRTVGRMTLKSLLRSLVRSHRSLIRLLRTARFARSLARSRPHGKEAYVIFIQYQPLVPLATPTLGCAHLLAYSLAPDLMA